jgi:hypothetical protein
MKNQEGLSHILTSVTHEKDLGVEIDNHLMFNQINKATRVLGAIKHTFKFLDQDAFLSLFKSLVRPHLEYQKLYKNVRLCYLVRHSIFKV